MIFLIGLKRCNRFQGNYSKLLQKEHLRTAISINLRAMLICWHTFTKFYLHQIPYSDNPKIWGAKVLAMTLSTGLSKNAEEERVTAHKSAGSTRKEKHILGPVRSVNHSTRAHLRIRLITCRWQIYSSRRFRLGPGENRLRTEPLRAALLSRQWWEGQRLLDAGMIHRYLSEFIVIICRYRVI